MLSIIVPIKNQEKYLEKCLDSILGQTYTDIEVVAVEDSSTDSSLTICNMYAARDERVKVIHVEHNDISTTRNTGVENATGDLIGFVDPDDWIEPGTFTYMVKLKQKTGANIVCCGKQEVYGDEPLAEPEQEQVDVLTRDEAIEILAGEGRIRSHLWNKIYDAGLFDGIRFEEGRIYEDLMVMHRIFQKTEKIALSNRVFYHYRQHPASALAKTNLRKKLDACFAVNQRMNDLTSEYPQLKPVLLKQYKYQIQALLHEMELAKDCEIDTWKTKILEEQRRCKQLGISLNSVSERLFGLNFGLYRLFLKIKRK